MPRPNRYLRLKRFANQQAWPAYRTQQILDAIFKQHAGSYAHMHTLPAALRKQLDEEFGPQVLSLQPLAASPSAQADKLLFGLSDGRQIETVAMRYRAGWHSYCLSSQAGCALGCRFCATAAMGLQRNLSADEICDQALYFHQAGRPLDSLSFMGMGEALANPNLFEALECLSDPALFALSPRRLSVSTVGLPRGIRRLSRQFPQVNLTFSLHSPFDEQRSQLMPVNLRYPLDEVLDGLDEHVALHRRKVYIAYLLLEGVNDSRQHAQALAHLLKAPGRRTGLFHVNLVRHNATDYAKGQYRRPTEAHIAQFRSWLEDAGLKVTVRLSFGAEISAACGQLHARQRQLAGLRNGEGVVAADQEGGDQDDPPTQPLQW